MCVYIKMVESYVPAGWMWLLNDSMRAEFTPVELRQLEWMMFQNISETHRGIDDPEYDLLRTATWRGLVLTLYIAVILIGITGNTIVIYVVVRNKHMQNVTNILIANLALSDISLCIFSLPIQLYYQITDHWIFGEALCRVVFTAFAMPMYVSTLSILLIAYDRYWLIVYPLKERMSIKMAIMLIVVTGILTMMLAIPVMCFTSVKHLDDPSINVYRKYCVENWPNGASRKAYSAITFSFQFCLPLIITGTLYSKIYQRLQHRPSTRITTVDRKQKTNKILLAIVILFVVCWLPWNVFSLLTELNPHAVKGSHFKFVDLLLKLFAMSSACINPFLYCWLNENFRKELSQLAVRLHVYRQPSLRNRDHRHYRIQSTADENGRITNDPYGTMTDRFSTSARLSAANIL